MRVKIVEALDRINETLRGIERRIWLDRKYDEPHQEQRELRVPLPSIGSDSRSATWVDVPDSKLQVMYLLTDPAGKFYVRKKPK